MSQQSSVQSCVTSLALGCGRGLAISKFLEFFSCSSKIPIFPENTVSRNFLSLSLARGVGYSKNLLVSVTQTNLIATSLGNRFRVSDASSVQQICKQKLTCEMTKKTKARSEKESAQTIVTSP